MRYLRYLWALALVLFVAFILYPKFKDTYQQIPSLLGEANKLLILFLAVSQTLTYLSDGWLSKIILEISGHNLKLRDTARIAVLGVLGSQIVPVIGGTLITYLFYKKLKVPSTSILFLVATWTYFIFLNYVLFLLLSLIFLPKGHLPSLARQVVSAISFMTPVSLILIYLLLRNRGKILVVFLVALNHVINKFSGLVFGKRLVNYDKPKALVLEFYKNLDFLLTHKTKIPKVFLASVIFYLSGIATLYFSFLVFGLQPNPSLLIFGFTFASILTLLTFVPETPGIMETSMVAVFVSLGFPTHITLFSSLLYRLFSYWLPLPLGALAYFRMKDR